MSNDFVMLFPGQGSQSVGMLAELANSYPLVIDTFQQASDALGFDLWRMTQEGPEGQLNQTHNTQPAMLAAGVAVWRVWLAQGGAMPTTMAGHSLGEYSALVCSGAMSFEEATRLVADRGRFMQEAVPEGTGAMAAILGLEDDQVRALCAQAAAGQVCEAVNFNSPGQVVAAGDRDAIDRLLPLAKEAGAKRALPPSVSVPSHCSLMRPAAERLAERLHGVTITTPSIPVIHNVNVALATDPEGIRQRLAEQLYQPVRWVETIEKMAAGGATLMLEAGPGKVLSGLCKRINKEITGLAVFDSAGLDKALEEVSHAG